MKNEVNSAISELTKDINAHEGHLISMNQQLLKDQMPPILKEIKKQVKLKAKKKEILSKYVNLYSQFLIPIQREENGMNALFDIVHLTKKTEI